MEYPAESEITPHIDGSLGTQTPTTITHMRRSTDPGGLRTRLSRLLEEREDRGSNGLPRQRQGNSSSHNQLDISSVVREPVGNDPHDNEELEESSMPRNVGQYSSLPPSYRTM